MPNTITKGLNNNKNLKRFGIISAIIFSFIVILSLVYITTCGKYSNCANVYLSVIHSIILSAGLIGLGYCLLVLKTFDSKVDKDLEIKTIDMVKELEKSENKINEKIFDDANKKQNNNKEITSFF